jgi:hypothetical protein
MVSKTVRVAFPQHPFHMMRVKSRESTFYTPMARNPDPVTFVGSMTWISEKLIISRYYHNFIVREYSGIVDIWLNSLSRRKPVHTQCLEYF